MKNEPLHNVLSFSDWPKVPESQAPLDSEVGLEVGFASVVRDALSAIGHDLAPNSLAHCIHLRNFRSGKYRLTEDLVVMLEERGDLCIARSYDTGQYGEGVSADDAIEHLCSVLEDYLELLQEERNNLSRQLTAHLRYLESILETL
jgi:hypothetical protein